MIIIPRTVLPKLFSTATQFLERQSIATHIALRDKNKFVLKRNFFYKNLELFLIMRRVWMVRLFPVTVDDDIDTHINASYF
jgi:hypothetical protein